MTLLLAFFIILQAFAPTQSAGLFYAGQGSFIRALETFGLGGVFEPGSISMIGTEAGARYLAASGDLDPSHERRIDPTVEAAEEAMEALSQRFDVSKPDNLTGWRATLPTPFSYFEGADEMTREQKEFCRELAWRLAPLLFARGFVFRIGTEVDCNDAEELQHTRLALARAGQVRAEIIRNMTPAARPAAERRLYCFCRRGQGTGDDEPLAGRIRVDILLTKPNIRPLASEGPGKGDLEESR